MKTFVELIKNEEAATAMEYCMLVVFVSMAAMMVTSKVSFYKLSILDISNPHIPK